MPSQTKARQLATKFDRAYPESLPERLAWWCRTLRIDRCRLLRMMGKSIDEAKREKDTSWDGLLENNEFVEKAWWVEGKLHELLALFDYDWNTLASHIHHAADIQEQQSVARQNGDIVNLKHVPSSNGPEVLLNQLAQGGPDSFPAIISYLGGNRAL